MAITPTEARELSQAEKDTFGIYEVSIDKILKERFTGASVRIRPGDLVAASRSIPIRIAKALKEKYEKAGWMVSLGSDDERQGDFIEFSIPKN